MAADQQFCLRWNNHQSTLVSVFDSLLEKGALVDCTLAAEGQFMKAHKVVLSACSPYFELLLNQHYDKHPIIILKEVKFQELKAIMDYMYRGEVNISQDQLASLLKVAESLQIKGLSEGGGGDDKEVAEPRPESRKPATPQRTNIENRRTSSTVHSAPIETPMDSPLPTKSIPRDQTASPPARKRKKRHPSTEESTSFVADGFENSMSSESQSIPVPNLPPQPIQVASVPVPSKPSTPVTPALEEKIDIKPLRLPPRSEPRVRPTPPPPPPPPAVPIKTELPPPPVEPPAEVMLQPKMEYVEENDVEDLTLDDDEEEEMMDQAQAGPSHAGDDSQGFFPWNAQGEASNDEMYAQDAGGTQRDSQGNITYEDLVRLTNNFEENKFSCGTCGKKFTSKYSLAQHCKWICGQEPKFQCPFCPHKTRQKGNLRLHVSAKHQQLLKRKYEYDEDTSPFQCKNCGRKYKQKGNLTRHMRYECGSAKKQQHCPVCAKSYSRPELVREHMLRCHEILPEQVRNCLL